MNSVKSPKFGAIYSSKIGQFDYWGDCYYHLIETGIADCPFYGTIGKGDSHIVLKAAKENMACLPKDEIAYFNHMDFHWKNFFVKEKDNNYEIAGIIDFGSSLFAPAYMDLYRLEGTFLYGTERFYPQGIRPFQIDRHELLCADLLNTLDYYVFLSFTNQANKNVRTHLIDICKNYITDNRTA